MFETADRFAISHRVFQDIRECVHPGRDAIMIPHARAEPVGRRVTHYVTFPICVLR